MNWTAVGKEHGISGGNAGQVVKEFAIANSIDITTMKLATPNRKATQRPRMKKLPGSMISVPSNPTLKSIEAEIRDMVASGRFTLGEECAPFKITKYVLENGKLTPRDILVQARKVPLTKLWQGLLKKHQKYMRLTPVEDMRGEEVRELLRKNHYTNLDAMTHENLCEVMMQAQTSRALCVWHDHATILKMGFILITIHVMYDSLVFLHRISWQCLYPV